MGEEIREEVAALIGHGLKDPRIGFVTVTRVALTDDLHHARIYVGVLGDAAQRARTLQALRQAAGFVRRELGRRLRTRYTPDISFHYDEGLDATDRVARLLQEAAEHDAAAAADAEGTAPAQVSAPRDNDPDDGR
jgi:ribosome-binding factor A